MSKPRTLKALPHRRIRWGILTGPVAALLVLAEAGVSGAEPQFRAGQPLLLAAAKVDGPEPRFRAGKPLLRPFLEAERGGEVTVQKTPPKAPTQFNPDPGQWDRPSPQTAPPSEQETLFPDFMPDYGTEPLPTSLKLPRGRVIGRDPIKKTFTYREYPLGREGLGLLPNSRGVPNRWMLPFPHWTRYMDPRNETPYMYETPKLWHPYEQSTLKGDVPIIGEDIFLNLIAKNFSLFEYRKLPVGSNVSSALPSSSEFFGRGEQVFFSNDTSLAFDLFKGETAFKPVTWMLRVNAVYNYNYLRVRENNLVDPDPRGPDVDDHKGNPDTDDIQAIPPRGDDVTPRPGNPGSFRTTVNPPDIFNYIAPQLRPLGNAKHLVKVDPVTQEIPENKKDQVNKKVRKANGRDLAGDTHYTIRQKDFFALQEAFGEIHIGDLTDNYDFISSRFGIQPFVSDFRGFIFADTNLAARIFGNADNNRFQYNLAYFQMLEKDTYSDLNTFELRHQQVFVANAFRQDFIWKGYTAQLSFLANFDDGGTHYDKNGFLTRPANFGTVQDERNVLGRDGGLVGHEIRSYYFGWTGDGHIGRLNITHAFYQVFGEDDFNQLANRRVDINAQMAALELSYDRDYIRFKLSGFYASGDSDPTDGTARGFDSIQDNPLFIGGPFSWYVHQGFNLAGTAVNFKQRDSLIPDLRSSKTEGQSNFVNPGVAILGIGTDIDVTPKLKAFANLNYIWLPETKPIEVALQTNNTSSNLGLDASLGFKFRPLLTDNIILSAGVGFFFPGQGYRDIYQHSTQRVPGFDPEGQEGKYDRYLYNGFVTLTFLY